MAFNIFKRNNGCNGNKRAEGNIRENIINCPRCSVKMEKLKKSGVIIDVCRKCKGMWLDAGEMEKLASMARKAKNISTRSIGNKKGGKNGKE